MIDTWKDAFTIVGGFVATAATVVTINRGQSSKNQMDIPNEILVKITTLCAEMEHIKGDFATMSKKWESTTRQINEIRIALTSLGTLDHRGRAKTTGSATETDEI